MSEPLTQDTQLDGDVAASESYLESVVEEAREERGAPAAPARAEEPAPEPAAGPATPEHAAHWRQRYEARQATQRALSEAQQRGERMERELAAIKQQVAQGPRPAPANPDPEPVFEQDPKGWYLWRDRETARQYQQGMVTALGPIYQYMLGQMQTGQQRQAAEQERSAGQAEAGRVNQLEVEYQTAVPAYLPVVHDAAERIAATYMALGHPQAQANEMAVRDLHAVWKRGEAAGFHPAQYLHQMLTYGGNGHAAAPAAAAPPPPPSPAARRVRDMQAAARAPEAGSLSQAGGAPTTVSKVAKLTAHGKGATSAAEARRAGVSEEDLYEVAFKQEFGG